MKKTKRKPKKRSDLNKALLQAAHNIILHFAEQEKQFCVEIIEEQIGRKITEDEKDKITKFKSITSPNVFHLRFHEDFIGTIVRNADADPITYSFFPLKKTDS